MVMVRIPNFKELGKKLVELVKSRQQVRPPSEQDLWQEEQRQMFSSSGLDAWRDLPNRLGERRGVDMIQRHD